MSRDWDIPEETQLLATALPTDSKRRSAGNRPENNS